MGLIYRQLASTDLQNQWILEIRNQVYYTNLRCVCRCFIIIYHLTCRSREKKISLNSFNVKYKRTVCCTCLPCRHSDKFQGFFPYIQDVKGGFGPLITRRAFYPKWIDLGVLKVSRSRNKIVKPKLLPKNEPSNSFFYPDYSSG